MIIYILKVSACLAIFIAFYKLFLENENMHVFKRFYLLTAIALAFIIPSLLFKEYVYVAPQPIIDSFTPPLIPQQLNTATTIDNTSSTNTILWTIYAIGVFVFGFKFCKNLLKIGARIRKNPKIKKLHITTILLKEKLSPHTFFNYIFLNKQKFEAQKIPDEVLLHEQTHATQKHSIDVLIVELIQVLFWFNPLIAFYKHSIKLNHEFLADQAVVQKGIETTSYQKILLAFSSNATETQLANAINYSSIKKRFTVMKKQTSKKTIWLRSLLVLPILAFVMYSFSESETIEIEKSNNTTSSHIKTPQQQKSNSIRYSTKPNAPNVRDIAKWKNASEYALWINGKHVPNKELESYKSSDFVHYFSSYAYNNARSKKFPQPYQVSLYSQKEFEKQFTINDREINIHINNDGQLLVQDEILSSAELKNYLEKLNTDLSKEERSKKVRAIIHTTNNTPENSTKTVNETLAAYGCATIDIVGHNKPQDRATEKQISEYNALAKKYNKQPINQRIIKQKDVEKLKFIFNLMTEEQKQNAQPYPLLPPPPPAPTPKPTTPKVMIGEKSSLPPPPPPPFHKGIVSSSLENAYNNWVKKLKNTDGSYSIITKENYNYFYSIYESMTDEQKNNALKMPPPPPPSALDYVIKMAKKEATFYYEDKKISADEAIELLKNNKKLNIDSRGTNNKKPVVKISKDPILISTEEKTSSNKNINTYIKKRNKLLNYIKVKNIDYPVGYLALSKLEQTEFNKIQIAMFQAFMDLSENEKQSAPKILPPPPSAKMYKLVDGKIVKKV